MSPILQTAAGFLALGCYEIRMSSSTVPLPSLFKAKHERNTTVKAKGQQEPSLASYCLIYLILVVP